MACDDPDIAFVWVDPSERLIGIQIIFCERVLNGINLRESAKAIPMELMRGPWLSEGCQINSQSSHSIGQSDGTFGNFTVPGGAGFFSKVASMFWKKGISQAYSCFPWLMS